MSAHRFPAIGDPAAAAGKHLPENVGDKPFELIVVELKRRDGMAK